MKILTILIEWMNSKDFWKMPINEFDENDDDEMTKMKTKWKWSKSIPKTGTKFDIWILIGAISGHLPETHFVKNSAILTYSIILSLTLRIFLTNFVQFFCQDPKKYFARSQLWFPELMLKTGRKIGFRGLFFLWHRWRHFRSLRRVLKITKRWMKSLLLYTSNSTPPSSMFRVYDIRYSVLVDRTT